MLSHRVALFVSLATHSQANEPEADAQKVSDTLATFDELYESVRMRRVDADSREVCAPTVQRLLDNGAAERIDTFRRRAIRLRDRIKRSEVVEHEHLCQFVDFVAGPLLETLSDLTLGFGHDLEVESKLRQQEMWKTLREIRSMSRGVHFISLNASIASARAGDSGALFGSIAKEIGALATESGASVERLAKLLGAEVAEL